MNLNRLLTIVFISIYSQLFGEVYSDKKNRVSMELPENWVLDERKDGDIFKMRIKPLMNDTSFSNVQTVHLRGFEHLGELDEETRKELLISMVKEEGRVFTNYKLLRSTAYSKDGFMGLFTEMEFQESDEAQRIRKYQLNLIKGDEMIIVTFESEYRSFDLLKPVFDKAISSLILS